MCTLLLFALLRRMVELTPFLPPFFIRQEISSFWGTSTAITPSGTQEVLATPAEKKYLTGSFFLTSSPSMTLTHPPFYIASLAVTIPFDISFAPTSLVLSCSWEMLQNPGSDHLPILLFVPLSLVYRPNERPPSFNFQKACWDEFSPYFNSHCPSAEEYPSLSLSSAAALFTSLALNAAKSSIPFGCIKPDDLLRWKERLVKDARLSLPPTEVMKIARLTSPLLDAPRQSSPRPRLRHGRRLAFLFHPNQNPKLSTLFFALSLALLLRLPPLVTSLAVLLPGNRLQSMPLA